MDFTSYSVMPVEQDIPGKFCQIRTDMVRRHIFFQPFHPIPGFQEHRGKSGILSKLYVACPVANHV
jgi:hypothetical protein